MAWTVQAGAISESVGLVGTTGFTNIGLPANLLPGELMVMYSKRYNASNDFDTPAGWTRQSAIDGNVSAYADDFQTAIFTKYAGYGEPLPDLTHGAGTSDAWMVVVLRYAHTDGVGVDFDVTPAASHYTIYEDKASPNGDAFDSITTVTDNSIVVGFEAVSRDKITSTPTLSGYDLDFDHSGVTTSGQQVMMWSKEITTAAAESPGTPSYTSSITTAESCMATFALRPTNYPVGILKRPPETYEFIATATGNDVVITVPLNALEDDYMVAILSTDDQAPALTVTPPSGWTLQFGPITGNGAASPQAEWFYDHTVTAADETNAGTATYTWSFSGSEHQVGVVFLFDPAEWGEEASTVNTGTATTAIAPSVTTTVANEIVVHGATKDGGVIFTGMPTGTEVVNNWWGNTGASGGAMAAVYAEYVSAGATGTKTFTHATEERQSWTFSVRGTGGFVETVTDALGLTDATSRVHDAVRTSTDAVGLTDTVTYEIISLPPLNYQNGSGAWVGTYAKVWDGAAWKVVVEKFYNGTVWKP